MWLFLISAAQQLSVYNANNAAVLSFKESCYALDGEQRKSIKSLTIQGDFTEQGMEALFEVLVLLTEVEVLNVRGGFGNIGALKWAERCSHLKQLKHFSIWGLYSDPGARDLFQWFKEQSSLISINIWAFCSMSNDLQAQARQEFPEDEVTTWYLKLNKRVA